MDDKILISDDINLANNFVGKVISWNDASDKKNVIDIPGYIAKNKEEIRATLLELTHQCAVFSLDNKSILEHLEIESDFSYWWFTTLGQLEPYSNGKSIYDLMRLISIKKILKDNPKRKIFLHIRDKKTFYLIADCLKKQEYFNTSRKFYLHQIYYQITKSFDITVLLLGFLKFCYFSSQRIRLNQFKKDTEIKNKKIYIYDILAHYEVISNKFNSGYWTDLKDYLDEQNISVEWCHIYYNSSKNSSLNKMVLESSGYDKNIENNTHDIIDKDISIRDFLSTIKKVFLLFIKYKFIIKKNSNKIFNSNIGNDNWNYFNIIDNDFKKSIIGYRSFINIYYFITLRNKIKKSNKDAVCLFVQENQPWEYSLSYFWKKYLNNNLIGVPHTTIPYFDFRYFFDKKTFGLWGYQPYLPPIMTLNGPDMEKKFSDFNFLPSKLCKTEALRYNYIENVVLKSKKICGTPSILIIGDLVKEITLKHLRFTQEWLHKFNPNVKIIFRPHPAAKINDYNQFNFFNLTKDSFVNDINNADMFSVNNTTSAAADIYALNLPLIMYDDTNRINFSPISFVSDQITVSNIDDFNNCFNQLRDKQINKKKFFNINKKIPLWKNLINQFL